MLSMRKPAVLPLRAGTTLEELAESRLPPAGHKLLLTMSKRALLTRALTGAPLEKLAQLGFESALALALPFISSSEGQGHPGERIESLATLHSNTSRGTSVELLPAVREGTGAALGAAPRLEELAEPRHGPWRRRSFASHANCHLPTLADGASHANCHLPTLADAASYGYVADSIAGAYKLMLTMGVGTGFTLVASSLEEELTKPGLRASSSAL